MDLNPVKNRPDRKYRRISTMLLFVLSALFSGIFCRRYHLSDFYRALSGWGMAVLGLGITFFLLGFFQLIGHHLVIQTEKQEKILTTVILLLVIFMSCFSMKLSPYWNGEIPGHRNQYEIMADSLLNGHLYMDYEDVDLALSQLDNPYDPLLRSTNKVQFHFDHAWYQGHYYMYFGIVPVILLFIPYKLLTGTALTTYHATQVFTSFYIIGIFLLFFRLRKFFFKRMPFSVFLLLSAACSLMSTWFIDTTPALYCTAISAGICCEIWSLFFFINAVWIEPRENRQMIQALLGSLFGALAFGCRPPIALANLMVIPFLIEFLRKKIRSHLFGPKLLIKLAAAALPYVIIGALLMAYNYQRFGNIFEFGQTLQLTNWDQHGYGFRNNFSLRNTFNYFYTCLLQTDGKYFGILLQFPVLWCCFLLFEKRTGAYLLKNHFYGSVLFFGITIGIVLFTAAPYAPKFNERYKMDIMWLFCLMTFFTAGGMFCSREGKRLWTAEKIVIVFSCLAIITCILLFLIPNDSNFAACYREQILVVIQKLPGLN